ncbi:MAG: phosphoenolpyruvate carboxylase, partial [Gammaproteobacteria bacterium]|nr:phosphoenolpyruvate carboxylase [Gammaproteobacteria bacterium]
MDERSINFPDKDVPLRNDVNTLGAIVGDVLIEQFGREVFDRVESLRTASIARRESGSEDIDDLASQIDGVELAQARNLIQGFSGYFQVVNLAERVHRIRRIRDYQRDGEAPADSLQQKLAELKAARVPAADIEELLSGLVIEPVMTAHPTEATRRTLLTKERAIATQLVQRFDDRRTPQEEAQALDRIREQITISWQTRPYSATKTTVAAEREHVLFYISDILYEIVPVFYAALRSALDASYPEVMADAALPRILGFGSWVGGDMDGNPNVDHRTLAASLAEHRRLIIERYIGETRSLAETLTQSLSEVPISAAVQNRVSDYEHSMPAVAARIEDRLADMPYRNLLVFIRARLRAVLNEDGHGYSSCDEFMADVHLIRDSLIENRGENAGLFKVDRFIWRIRTFGFYLATLDVRQDSADLRAAVADLISDEGWESRSVAERTTRLTDLLEQSPALPPEPGSQLERALAVLQTIDKSRDIYGKAAIGSFIISMAQGADDVLTVLLLARAAGLADDDGKIPLDVAPLLETVDDLQRGESILRQLADIAAYRRHLSHRGNRQLIMVGYSDSSKDGGIASARWALQQAQRDMSMAAADLGLKIGFFHGRGGTVSRGGGNMVRGIYAAPAHSVDGYMRITEQGEVIHQKYGIRPLALRNLEQITGATIAASLKAPLAEGEQWSAMMSAIADESRKRYR